MGEAGRRDEHTEKSLSAPVITAHFPLQMFYLPAGPFMDNTGGLSVVSLRDQFSAEISTKKRQKKKKHHKRFYSKGPLWHLACVVKNTAGAQAHLKMHLIVKTGLMHKYIQHPPAVDGSAPFTIMALFRILNTSENIYICV